MNKKKIIIIVGVAALVICMLIIGLLLAAGYRGGPTSDAAAIEDTIRGYVTTFNAEDFDKCLTYFANYEDKEDALAFLSFIRSLSGPLELLEIKDIAIFTPIDPGSSQTATATVIFTITGEEGTDQMQLKKVQGQWKILWEQETPAPTPTDGYLPEIDVEVALALQGVVQVEHYLWFEEDGLLWLGWRVWNTGDQAIDLCYEVYGYDAEGQEIFIEGYCEAGVSPGSCLGYCDGSGRGIGIITATHYKIIVDNM